MEEEHLHLLITEEVYLLPQDKEAQEHEQSTATQVDQADNQPTADLKEDKSSETPEPQQQVAKEETPKVEEKQKEKAEETPAHIETKQESPEIPSHDHEPSEELPFAIFHSSTNADDIELLQKIIQACKLPENEYKIFSGGFDQSVHFKKALVFVPEAKAFYTPIPYKNSEFLCAKPLNQISGDVQEKAKLWTALQKFVDSLVK